MSPPRALPCEKIHPFYLVPIFMIHDTRVVMIAEKALHIQSSCILPLSVKTPLDDMAGLAGYLAKACGETTDNPIGIVMEVDAGDRDNKMMFFMFTGSE